MTKIRTHYDTLGVSRSAQPDIIRLAYKRLAQKYHPDKNMKELGAERIMKVLNTAYITLSDPVQRAEHDRWIDEQHYLSQSGSGYQDSDYYKSAERPYSPLHEAAYEQSTATTHAKPSHYPAASQQAFRHTNHSYYSQNIKSTQHNPTFWSMNGRISRRQYALLILPTLLVWDALAFYYTTLPDFKTIKQTIAIPLLLFFFTTVAFLVFLTVKRLHDINYHGWWSVIPFASIALLFVEGTAGANRFGSDPAKNRQALEDNQTLINSPVQLEQDISGWVLIGVVFISALLTLFIYKDSHRTHNNITNNLNTLSGDSITPIVVTPIQRPASAIDYQPNYTPALTETVIANVTAQPENIITFNHNNSLIKAKADYALAHTNITQVWDDLPANVSISLLSEQQAINQKRESYCKQQALTTMIDATQQDTYRYACEAALLNERADALKTWQLNTQGTQPNPVKSQVLQTRQAEQPITRLASPISPPPFPRQNTINTPTALVATRPLNPVTTEPSKQLLKAKRAYEIETAHVDKVWNDLPASIRASLYSQQQAHNKQRALSCKQQSLSLKGSSQQREAFRYHCEVPLLNERATYLANYLAQSQQAQQKPVPLSPKSTVTFAKTQAFAPMSASNLSGLIQREGQKKVAALNRRNMAGSRAKYKVSSRKTLYTDINDDGVKDAIVGLGYCEAAQCQMSSHSFDLVLFLGTGNNDYVYKDTKTLGTIGSILMGKQGVIQAQVKNYKGQGRDYVSTRRNFKVLENTLVEVY